MERPASSLDCQTMATLSSPIDVDPQSSHLVAQDLPHVRHGFAEGTDPDREMRCLRKNPEIALWWRAKNEERRLRELLEQVVADGDLDFKGDSLPTFGPQSREASHA